MNLKKTFTVAFFLLLGCLQPAVADSSKDLKIDLQCRHQDLLMEVHLDSEGILEWQVQSVSELNFYFVESGTLQIEEGPNAYSAIGEKTALALKGQRAALVFENNQALVFDCY
ncbi:MAG: hypothetical protein ACLGGX_04390 [Bdellovibrionia bacterium]